MTGSEFDRDHAKANLTGEKFPMTAETTRTRASEDARFPVNCTGVA
jgi:hypothetical protein